VTAGRKASGIAIASTRRLRRRHPALFPLFSAIPATLPLDGTPASSLTEDDAPVKNRRLIIVHGTVRVPGLWRRRQRPVIVAMPRQLHFITEGC